jgi:hypothetical protein
MTLGASKGKKENKAPVDGCRGLGYAKLTSKCLLMLVGVAEVLTLFLLPNGLSWWSLARVEEEISATDALGLFLLPLGRPRPHFSTTTPSSRLITPVSAMVVTTMGQWKAGRNPRQYGEEDDAATNINSGEIGLKR